MTTGPGAADATTPTGTPREVFSVFSSISGEAETFEDARAAGRAFFLADPAERPTVIHSAGNSARTMARTEVHGEHPGGEPRYFKSLASSHEPDAAFREGFLEAMEKSLKERLGQIAADREPARTGRFDTRLVDDLEAFAYREPGKAAGLWSGLRPEPVSGPVLKAAVAAQAADLAPETESGRAAVSRASQHSSETKLVTGALTFDAQSKDWER